MLSGFRNHLMNPQFQLWDYGTGAFTTSTFTATRWKLERTGTAGVVSVSQGTVSSDAAVAKVWRGRNCLAVTTTAGLLTTDTGPIRQRIENGERFGQQSVRMTVVAAGTSGKTFEYGITAGSGGDHRYGRITTTGETTPVVGSIEVMLPLPSTTYWIVDCFRPVSASATFKIIYVHLEYRHNGVQQPHPYELREPGLERLLCARYVWPIGGAAEATSTTAIAAVARPPVEMRAAPSVVKVSNPTFVDMAGVSTAGSGTTFAVTDATTGGARVTANGFTGLTSGSRGMFSAIGSALLEAEL
jgi:hypothetical protein